MAACNTQDNKAFTCLSNPNDVIAEECHALEFIVEVLTVFKNYDMWK